MTGHSDFDAETRIKVEKNTLRHLLLKVCCSAYMPYLHYFLLKSFTFFSLEDYIVTANYFTLFRIISPFRQGSACKESSIEIK